MSDWIPPRKLSEAQVRGMARAIHRDPDAPQLDDQLGLCRCIEHGKIFETGHAVSFNYMHNTERSPHVGATFGQDIEPAGRYMLHKDPVAKARGSWVTGKISFRKPLVLFLTRGADIYGPLGWKARLSHAFGGAKGSALTARLRAAGFDGIVTCYSETETAEIVELKQRRRR